MRTTLKALYKGRAVEIFLSSKSIIAGDWRRQIDDTLMLAKCGITILTPENKEESPWLMYEAGALNMQLRLNNGVLIPYLFCRHLSDLERPLDHLQAYQYQFDDDENEDSFVELLKNINLFHL